MARSIESTRKTLEHAETIYDNLMRCTANDENKLRWALKLRDHLVDGKPMPGIKEEHLRPMFAAYLREIIRDLQEDTW